jgi:hypothetical protein
LLSPAKANGSLDRSFSGDGRTTTGFSDDAAVSEIAIDGNRIVAAGRADHDFALARYIGG